MPGPLNIRGVRIGVPVCEDIWTPDVVECLAETGAEILLVPNGSPFDCLKMDHRLNVAVARVVEAGLPLVYLNQVGGQDELVFDGGSFVLNADRRLALQLPSWQEAVVTTEWRREAEGWICAPGASRRSGRAACGALFGDGAGAEGLCEQESLSRRGARAFGRHRFRADGGGGGRCAGRRPRALRDDAVALHLGRKPGRCRVTWRSCWAWRSTPCRLSRRSWRSRKFFAAGLCRRAATDIADENMQSRIRGLILMAISNAFGPMVLTTGNKSEMSVGYATLYGDMVGGYNVLKDLYKTQVFALARWRNATCAQRQAAWTRKGRVMPERVIGKPPTAELRANQKDEDSLPPYAVLDGILECLVEGEMGFEEVVAKGYDPVTVKRVEQMLYVAEYKRRQAAPGVKLSARNFGRDRRYPITNAYRDARSSP